MRNVKVPQNEHISRWDDPENLIYVQNEEGDWWRKTKEDTEWNKASQNISTNPQSFLE